jgi:hypothetical protein
MTDTATIRKRSVTSGDIADTPYSAPWFVLIPQQYGTPTYTALQPYWSQQRDYQLRATIDREDMWASAIYKAITKIASLGLEFEDTDDSDLRTRRSQQLLLLADAGGGWVKFISKVLRDYLLTDNGAFVEVVRASKAAGSRIIGLMHLDSCRITRTGDPSIPVLYRDRKGVTHEMKDYQVLTFADLPDPSETYNGVGRCAASRAYHTIVKLSALEQYGFEKMSGDGATELSFVQGLSDRQLSDAILTGDAEQKRKGAIYYKGKLVVPIMGDVPLNLVNIPLKNVPDGFDAKQERDNAYMVYANAIGIPVQDIQPLSGQGLGTGTQTVILDEASEGQGLAAFLKDWVHTLNEYVFPDATTMSFSNPHDTRDQKARAEVQQIRANTRAAQIKSGEISPPMSRQLAVDSDDLPPEFLDNDATAAGQLSDTEKPLGDASIPARLLLQGAPQTMPQPSAGSGGSFPPAVTKTKRLTVEDILSDETMVRAAQLYAEVVNGR